MLLWLLSQLNIDRPKTKDAVELLNRLDVQGNVLIVISEKSLMSSGFANLFYEIVKSQ